MNIVEFIQNSQKVLIVGHMRPDGDCFGAGLTLLKLCENMGKNALFACDSELSGSYSFMKGFQKVNNPVSLNAGMSAKKQVTNSASVQSKNVRSEDACGAAKGGDFDLLIVVDCGDEQRMGKYREYLKRIKLSINIDHHITNNGFAEINILQKNASSTCEMVFELLESEEARLSQSIIDSDMAECLYVGLSTDTGHFMHNTTSERVFAIASRLVSLGADPFAIGGHLYKNRTIAKTKLIAHAIKSLRFFRQNSIAIITIFLKDLLACDCNLTDTEGLIDYAMAISGVRVAACVAEQRDKVFKISLRSKGTNVSRIAGFFGGGGHERAAGCMINGYYEDVIRKLERAINNEIDEEEGL